MKRQDVDGGQGMDNHEGVRLVRDSPGEEARWWW